MSATEMEHDSARRDHSVVKPQSCAGIDEQRVIDFYRSIGSPFFGAVVSSSGVESSTLGSESSHPRKARPTLVTAVGELDLSTAPQIQDRIADQLAGPVIGNVPAAIGFKESDAHLR